MLQMVNGLFRVQYANLYHMTHSLQNRVYRFVGNDLERMLVPSSICYNYILYSKCLLLIFLCSLQSPLNPFAPSVMQYRRRCRQNAAMKNEILTRYPVDGKSPGSTSIRRPVTHTVSSSNRRLSLSTNRHKENSSKPTLDRRHRRKVLLSQSSRSPLTTWSSSSHDSSNGGSQIGARITRREGRKAHKTKRGGYADTSSTCLRYNCSGLRPGSVAYFYCINTYKCSTVPS